MDETQRRLLRRLWHDPHTTLWLIDPATRHATPTSRRKALHPSETQPDTTPLRLITETRDPDGHPGYETHEWTLGDIRALGGAL